MPNPGLLPQLLTRGPALRQPQAPGPALSTWGWLIPGSPIGSLAGVIYPSLSSFLLLVAWLGEGAGPRHFAYTISAHLSLTLRPL